MARPVVHFEIIGSAPAALRDFYARLFGWEYSMDDAVTDEVSQPGEYGFVSPGPEGGIPGGVGGGPGLTPRARFYVGVPDVGEALAEAVRLGATAVWGPAGQGGPLVVATFTDPEGNEIGLAGPK